MNREPQNPRGLYHADHESDFGGFGLWAICSCCGRTHLECPRDCPNYDDLHDIDDDDLDALCDSVDVDTINEVTP